MDRVLLTLAVVVFFLLCLCGMWLGWRRRARSQSARVLPFPVAPDELGDELLAAQGIYVSTTRAHHWQDRIVTRGMGLRTSASWRLYAAGIEVIRVGAEGFWIPIESIVDIRTDKAIAGKVMGIDGLLVITWRLGDVLLDSGFRGDSIDDYPEWIDKTRELTEVEGGSEGKSGRENTGTQAEIQVGGEEKKAGQNEVRGGAQA
jgi:hypothetical protein